MDCFVSLWTFASGTRLDGDNEKKFCTVIKGVPQGSVLGPLRFLVFIGDVERGLDNDVKYLVYADDLQIYLQCSSSELPDRLRRLCLNANAVTTWATTNHLSLSLDKTKAIAFSSNFYAESLVNQSIQVSRNSTKITETTVRDLGVVLDSRLN